MWRLKIEEKCSCQEFYRFFLSGLTLQCFQQCATNKLPASIYSTIHEYHAVVCILHRIYCTIQCLTETVMLWLTWPLIGWFIQCVSGYSFTLFLSYSRLLFPPTNWRSQKKSSKDAVLRLCYSFCLHRQPTHGARRWEAVSFVYMRAWWV